MAVMSETADRRALAALVFGACVIGFAPIGVRLTETGPAAAGFWRLGLAAPLLLLPALRAPQEMVSGRAWLWGLGAGVLFAFDLGAWHYGVHLTSVTNATVLSNTTPVVVSIAAWLLFRERPSRGFTLALALALGGAIAMGLAKGSGGRGTDPLLGDILSLVTAVFYGLYFVTMRIARRFAKASALMLWTTLSGAPALLLIGLLMGERILPAGPGGWLACVGLGVMHVSGQGAIAWALGRLPATVTSVVVLVQPIVAALLGWMLFGEAIAPLQGLAAAVVLAGVVLAQRSAAAARRAKDGNGEQASSGHENGPGGDPRAREIDQSEGIRATSD
jgi:drug/metabolite transporter (DMT)-like permease